MNSEVENEVEIFRVCEMGQEIDPDTISYISQKIDNTEVSCTLAHFFVIHILKIKKDLRNGPNDDEKRDDVENGQNRVGDIRKIFDLPASIICD